MTALASTALPQLAYAAPASGDGDGTSIVDTVKGWFDDDDEQDAKPPVGGKLEMPSRQKLPRGKNQPKATRVKELTSHRTASARYWQLSDGRVEAELSGVPESFRDGKHWKQIDTGVKATDRRGYDFANTHNLGRSYFGHSAANLLRFEADATHAVTLGLSGAKGELKPRVKGATVTYRDAASGADLVYEVRNGAVKENIVLAERPDTAVKFVFTLKTDGLTPKALKNGTIALYKDGVKQPVMVIPAAFMTDAKKDKSSPYGHAASTKVTQKLSRDGKDYLLTVTPDAEWLASTQRAYPVRIDPTITYSPPPCDDSNFQGCLSQGVMVDSSQPDKNYNGVGTSKTGNWQLGVGTTATGKRRSLIKFPLDGIPAGAKIDSARLGLYFDQAHTTGANNVTVEAHRATGTWEQTAATWNNTSSLSGELSGTTVQVDDGDAGTTAAVGEWPRVGTIGGVNIGNDYAYNKNSLTGESYTWQPKVNEAATYKVEAHFAPLSDATTVAPYTVTYDNNGTPTTANYTVDQSAGSSLVWKQLGTSQLQFAKGTAGKVVLGDTGDSAHRTVADAVW
ncbi:DNRLRE domain-containing protein [Streptomyces sp. NPDC002523]